MARRGIESREKLGRYRWVVERTFGWLGWSRRLSKDEEMLTSVSDAFIHAAMIQVVLRWSPT